MSLSAAVCVCVCAHPEDVLAHTHTHSIAWTILWVVWPEMTGREQEYVTEGGHSNWNTTPPCLFNISFVLVNGLTLSPSHSLPLYYSLSLSHSFEETERTLEFKE